LAKLANFYKNPVFDEINEIGKYTFLTYILSKLVFFSLLTKKDFVKSGKLCQFFSK